MKGWKKTFYANSKQKRAEVAILTLEKIYSKLKKVTRQTRSLYINTKLNTT